MSSSKENLRKKTIDDLPDEVLEYILSLVSPYKDSESCKLVSKRWCRTIKSVNRHSKCGLCRSVLNSSVLWQCLVPPNLEPTTITKRYSHAACYCDSFMYVFGGCTSRWTTFNDLWTLDLSRRIWIRPCTKGAYPSPKAYATLCCYKKNLVLFGGWARPSPYPIRQMAILFNELHIYDITSNKWTVIHSTISPPPVAGHSATIHGNLMVVFGGLQKAKSCFLYRSSNHVWYYNLETGCWSQPETSEPRPKSRYGQSQIYLNDENILIIGGCEGPNSILDDVWLLTITPSVWVWKQIKVNNSQWAAPHLWCHPACRVGEAVVVFSSGTSQALSYFSLSSNVYDDSSLVYAPIPPEVVARIAYPLPDIKDKNVNGQRGSLGKSSRSLDEPGTSSSSSCDDPSSREPSPVKSGALHSRGPPPHCSGPNFRMETDIQMAAFRDENTCPRYGTNSRNRMKQLELLRKMEEKYKDKGRVEPRRKPFSEEDPEPSDNQGNRMNMYVLDISEVLKENACVSWRPPRFNSNAPLEKMFHSLVLGKGELIMFGGLQKNIVSLQFPDPICKNVSNATHIITAPRNIV